MKNSRAYAAPAAVLSGIVGWLTWSYADAPAKTSDAKVKITPIEAALLSPALGKAAPRDPFVIASEAEVEKAAEKPKPPPVAEKPKPEAPDGKVAGKAPAPAAAGPMAGMFGDQLKPLLDNLQKLKATGDEMNERAKQALSTRAAIAQGVRLSATSLGANCRLAMLNDRLYAEGDTITVPESVPGPIVLTRVRQRSVSLRYPGGTIVLSFPSTGSGEGRARPAVVAAAPAKPKSAGAGAAKKGSRSKRPTNGRKS